MSLTPVGTFTRVLKAAGQGDEQAAADLLPMIYQDLRVLARARIAHVPPGNTLQPTALVHEAYLRLFGNKKPDWENRGHFFGAAAQAMRQILVDQARRKAALKRGGHRLRGDLGDHEAMAQPKADEVLAVNEALERLEHDDQRKAKIVMLRYFAGLSREEAAEAMGISLRTIDREWRFIRARLHKELSGWTAQESDGDGRQSISED